MPVQTNNFNPKSDPKLLCTCGNPSCDKRSVKQSALNKLQLVRESASRPLIITSGGRCDNHPNETNRSTPADHQKGCGIDVFVGNGFERGQLVELGLKHGFNAIGIAKNFVHLGYRHGGSTIMWVY